MSFHKIKAESSHNMKKRVHRASGGGVHGDEAQDRAMIKRMVKPEARTGKADGGPTKHKGKGGKTQVNVLVGGSGRGSSAAPMAGGAGVSRAPVPPVGASPAMAPGGLGGGQAMGPRPFKKGGKAHRADGGRTYHAGAATGEGRLEKARRG
jgi:hypothetical protein